MNDRQVEALASSGFYSRDRLHGVVEETHISWVILTPRYAFKIKKPLKFSFLDFTTASRRRKYCERELELNRRFSHIYLDVLPVKREAASWRIGNGPGKTVDYAVMMKRMKSSKRMDILLKSGRVDDTHMLALAREVSSFHRRAEVIHSVVEQRKMRRMFNDIRAIAPFTPSGYRQIITRAIEWSNSFIKVHGARFRQRVETGFRRDVHGDLHSGNIFLYRQPVIFDCIEFNDDFRHIDVLDEIAFFCMDMEAHGKGRLAAVFLREYRKRFSCFKTREDLAIFNYYKCYRANVRAKVSALAAAQEADPAARRPLIAKGRRYLKLMDRYMRSATK